MPLPSARGSSDLLEVTQQSQPLISSDSLVSMLVCPLRVMQTPDQGASLLRRSGSKQPRKSTRQSTHVEEIGLVPLAEEPLCRHVLQLLPWDTAA